MADTKISALTSLTGANVDTAADLLAIVDTSVATTKKIIPSELGIALAAAVKLQTNSPSGSTTSVFDNLLTSTYDSYELHLSNVTVGTDQEGIAIQVGTGAGPTYQSTNYQYAKVNIAASGTTVGGESSAAASDNTTSQIVLTRLNGFGGAVGNAAGEALSGIVRIFKPSSALHKHITWHVAYTDSAGGLEYYSGSGMWKDTTAITSILVKTTTGGTLSGTIELRGIRQ